MDRVAMLRGGYGALGVSLVAFGASAWVGVMVFPGLVLAFLGALLLALSGDDLPRWSGLALLLYFVVSLLAFLAATPVTVRLEFFQGFLNDDPSPVAGVVFSYLVLALPLMVSGTASAAGWEREMPPRVLLAGAVGGFILVGILQVVLVPPGSSPAALGAAESQGNLLRGLFGLSAGVGALGALWAAGRPDEYA